MSINEQLWDFPHEMTLKVMGKSDSPLVESVVDILNRYLDDFDAEQHLHITPSGKGNFISVNARVVMRHGEQVSAVYAELDSCIHVKVVF